MKYYIYRAYLVIFPIMYAVMGCGGAPLPRGVHIQDLGPYTEEEVTDSLVTIISMIDDVKHGFAADMDKEIRVDLYFTDGMINCGGTMTGGCTHPSGLDKIVEVMGDSDIVGCTALSHEFIHVAGYDHEGDWDTEVDHTIWYSQYDPKGSMESHIFDVVCNAFIE